MQEDCTIDYERATKNPPHGRVLCRFPARLGRLPASLPIVCDARRRALAILLRACVRRQRTPHGWRLLSGRLPPFAGHAGSLLAPQPCRAASGLVLVFDGSSRHACGACLSRLSRHLPSVLGVIGFLRTIRPVASTIPRPTWQPSALFTAAIRCRLSGGSSSLYSTGTLDAQASAKFVLCQQFQRCVVVFRQHSLISNQSRHLVTVPGVLVTVCGVCS